MTEDEAIEIITSRLNYHVNNPSRSWSLWVEMDASRWLLGLPLEVQRQPKYLVRRLKARIEWLEDRIPQKPYASVHYRREIEAILMLLRIRSPHHEHKLRSDLGLEPVSVPVRAPLVRMAGR